MTHATLAITALLLVLPGCSDYGAPGFGSGVGASAPRASAPHPAAHAAVVPASVHVAIDAAVVMTKPRPAKTPHGVFDIDLEATAECAGLFASLVEGKVRGSSLELHADGRYVGRKGDEQQSAGTFRRVGDVLQMKQTHEEGEPVEKAGTASLDGDMLVVKTNRHGLTITLVFQRRR